MINLNYLLFFLIYLSFSPTIFSQTQQQVNDLHRKYWWYRYRLINDFIVIGDKPGMSLPASERNYSSSITTLIDNQSDIMQWGDTGIRLGEYLILLGLESKILLDEKRNSDLNHTFRELAFAINAFERLDRSAETYYDDIINGRLQPLPENLNGLFIRIDVPVNFVQSTPHNLNTNKTRSSNSRDVQNTNTNENGIPELMSQDQIYKILAGLFVVWKSLPDQVFIVEGYPKENRSTPINFKTKAKGNINRIINYLEQNNYVVKHYTTPGNRIKHDIRGTDLRLRKFPIRALHSIVNKTAIPYLPKNDPLNYATWNIQKTNLPITFYCDKYNSNGKKIHGNMRNNIDNDHQTSILSAITNSWYYNRNLVFSNISSNNTKTFLTRKTKFRERNWYPYYLNLLKYSHGTNISSDVNRVSFDQLNSAPCEGPYRFYNSFSGNGWAGTLKWITDHYNQEAEFENTKPYGEYCMYTTGYFPGLDFMSLHNLYVVNNKLTSSYSNLIFRTIDFTFRVNKID